MSAKLLIFWKRIGIEIRVNPLTPKSDWHLISPYHIISESSIKVGRIKELTTHERRS